VTEAVVPMGRTGAPAGAGARFERLRTVGGAIIGYGLLAFAAFATIAPFLWMVSTSLKADSEIFEFPPSFIPHGLAWQNYIDAMNAPDAGRQLVNSLIYAGGSTLSNLLFCSLAGYALARMRFKGRTIVFGLVLALLMVPAQSQIVPVFVIVQKIPFAGGNDWLGNGGTGLLNTYWGMILPTAATPFGIFLMRQFLHAHPARIRGIGAHRRRRSVHHLLVRGAAAGAAGAGGARRIELSERLE
jgi:multiple sugar transport system permease protein